MLNREISINDVSTITDLSREKYKKCKKKSNKKLALYI